jgi:hypothetical protein
VIAVVDAPKTPLSHRLGRLLPVSGSGIAADAQPESRERLL